MLNELISTITNRGLSLIGLGESGSVARNADQLIELCDLLITNQDEASGIALSCELLSSYHGMEEAQREAFLLYLNRELATDPVVLELAARAYSKDQNIENLDRLSKALKSRSYQLLYRLGQSPGGIHDLVNMRADLLSFRKKGEKFESLDRDFVELFTVWFNRGFLELRQIDWNTPATILEKIIKYEAVHGIDDWDQLRARLDPADRMVYAFFHPCLEDEPLILLK